MWLNKNKINAPDIQAYKADLRTSTPHYIVIDGLFDEAKLSCAVDELVLSKNWQTQRHTYSALYVDDAQWQSTGKGERFVQRDVWQRGDGAEITANEFLLFLRSSEFMQVLSRIFDVEITDKNVEDPAINSNYFRLNSSDFIEQHADDSPGREVCMLLYLNKDWQEGLGGELCFKGKEQGEEQGEEQGKGQDSNAEEGIEIAPLHNRCVLFDPSSQGSEHWVKALNTQDKDKYRYNVTSWYWSE